MALGTLPVLELGSITYRLVTGGKLFNHSLLQSPHLKNKCINTSSMKSL